MQALDWTILHPNRVERGLIIGVAPLGAMGLALNHLQRQAILHDPDWAEGRYLPQRPPRRGLALARQIGMISYKSAPLLKSVLAAIPTAAATIPGAWMKGKRLDRRTFRHCRLPGPSGATLH